MEAKPGGRLATVWHLVRRVLALYLLVVLVMALLENWLIFIPSPYPAGDWTPPGLAFEDANFEAPDGVRLHGWFVPHERPQAAILFCHGNAGNVTHRVEAIRLLGRVAGASVLCFDYRGYGRSEGRPSEAGVLADARAARVWLARRAGIVEKDVVLMGESIGGAVAVDLAADGARALILESTFDSLPNVAACHFPWLPVRWIMRTQLDSASKIGRYHGPLLQSHGDPDTIVPYRFGQRLFEAANEPKHFMTFPGVDHNDPRPPDWYRAIREFLAKLPKEG